MMDHVEIKVAGRLDIDWGQWLQGFTVKHIAGDTLLVGQVKDQSDLYGIFAKLRDLGVSLVSVNIEGKPLENC